MGMYLLAAFFLFQLVSIMNRIIMSNPPDIGSFILLSGFTTRVYRIIAVLLLAALVYGIIRKRSYTIVLGVGFMAYKVLEKTAGITIEFWYLFPSKEFVNVVTYVIPLVFIYMLIIFYLYKNRKHFIKEDKVSLGK